MEEWGGGTGEEEEGQKGEEEVVARVGRDSRWQRDIARFHISPLHPPSGFLSLLSRFTCHVSFFLLRFYTRSTDNCDTDRPEHVCKFVKMTDGRGQSAPQPIEKASLREKFPLIIPSCPTRSEVPSKRKFEKFHAIYFHSPYIFVFGVNSRFVYSRL